MFNFRIEETEAQREQRLKKWEEFLEGKNEIKNQESKKDTDLPLSNSNSSGDRKSWILNKLFILNCSYLIIQINLLKLMIQTLLKKISIKFFKLKINHFYKD